MTDDLRARIECALGLHPAIRNGQTVPLADAVMEIVQPIADELTENEGVIKALRRQRDEAEAEIDRLTATLLQHEACRTCGHERHEHAHDTVIRAEYCGRCTVSRDIHDFQPEEQP